MESVKESFRLAGEARQVHRHPLRRDRRPSFQVPRSHGRRGHTDRDGVARHREPHHRFGSYDNAYAFKLMGFLAKSGMNFVANPWST